MTFTTSICDSLSLRVRMSARSSPSSSNRYIGTRITASTSTPSPATSLEWKHLSSRKARGTTTIVVDQGRESRWDRCSNPVSNEQAHPALSSSYRPSRLCASEPRLRLLAPSQVLRPSSPVNYSLSPSQKAPGQLIRFKSARLSSCKKRLTIQAYTHG